MPEKTPFLLGNSQIGKGHPAQIDLDSFSGGGLYSNGNRNCYEVWLMTVVVMCVVTVMV